MARRPPIDRLSAQHGRGALASAAAPRMLVATMVSVGCLGGQTGQDSEDSVTCEERSLPVEPHERTSAGFSGEELINELSTPWSAPLRFVERGQSTMLTLTVRGAHQPRLVFSEALSGACVARLHIDVSVMFTTDDGEFAETFPATLQAEAPTTWVLDQELPLSGLTGSYDGSEFIWSPGRSPRSGFASSSGKAHSQVKSGWAVNPPLRMTTHCRALLG